MRWLNTVRATRVTQSRERGATALVVAGSMVVLMGFSALAVDVGRLYWERAELQNGADMAALSIAQACAKSLDSGDCKAPDAAALDIAGRNALDGQSAAVATLDTSIGRVQVDTAASEVGASANSVSLFFARIFGAAEAEVEARAVARWGAPTSSTGKFPLAFSRCEVDSSPLIDGQLQYLLAHGVQDSPADDKCTNPSGQEVPGGFGWLVPDSGCSVDTAIGQWEPGGTGNAYAVKIDACVKVLESWITRLKAGETITELFPVFEEANKTGKQFRIWAYAAVEIKAWHFDNINNPKEPLDYLPGSTKDHIKGLGYKNEDLGFLVRFVRYVFEDEAGSVGGTPSPYGATIVALTE